MISSTSFLNSWLALCSLLLVLSGCAGGRGAPGTLAPGFTPGMTVAVLPVENLSSRGEAPLRQMRLDLMSRLSEAGLVVLDEARLEQFMARHRVRYVGGVDQPTAAAFLKETGTQAVLITDVTLYLPEGVPKIGVYSRLVSTGEHPEILWMDGVGMVGDDHPGFLGLGLVSSVDTLQDRCFDRLMESLQRRMEGKPELPRGNAAAKYFRPKIMYNPGSLAKGVRYSIGVVPFANASDRRLAGDIASLQLLRELVARGDFAVMEPGVLRDKLLELRIIMEQGLSLQDLFLVHKKLDTDLLLAGTVLRYEDPSLPLPAPRVEFSTLLMQGEGKRVIWASKSYNQGAERVFFFDAGRISTALELTSRMARALLSEADRRSAAPPREVPAPTDIFKSILEGRH
jgi:hypothetical protein